MIDCLIVVITYCMIERLLDCKNDKSKDRQVGATMVDATPSPRSERDRRTTSFRPALPGDWYGHVCHQKADEGSQWNDGNTSVDT